MTDCWRRLRYVSECECCGLVFTDVGALYEAHQPACPDCQELLEQPGFEYGLCDECGSKFEIVGDMIPNLLPNRAQREEMDRRANS